jgi:ribosome biogenesis ATPase
VPKRDDSLSEASARVVNTLLTELDGLSGSRDGIYIIAATNRPETIDPAMLRPGRLETLLFVGLPNPKDRVQILKTQLRKTPISLDIASFAELDLCHGFTGADLGSLVRKAGQNALKRGGDTVVKEDFEVAVKGVRRSVLDLGKYEKMQAKFASLVS